MKKIAFCLGFVAFAAGAAIVPAGQGVALTVPAGETWTVESEDDIAALNAAGETVVSEGATLKFAVCSQNLAAGTKISGPGTVEFDYNAETKTDNLMFKAQWDGSGMTGELVVRTESALSIQPAMKFGSAKIIAYVSTCNNVALTFAQGVYDIANEFELHGRSSNNGYVMKAEASDVTIRGDVSISSDGGGYTRIIAISHPQHEYGQLRFFGNANVSCNLFSSSQTIHPDGIKPDGRPSITWGDGTGRQTLSLGGCNLNCDSRIGKNVIACAVTNGSLTASNGNLWQFEIDNPFRSSGPATVGAMAGLSVNGTGGRFDLNGCDLLSGEWQYGNRWVGNWFSRISTTAEPVCDNGFVNNAKRFSTLYARTMPQTSPNKHLRILMEGRMNIAYDGHFAADSTDPAGDHYNGSWSMWIGNYPGASSSICGSIRAVRGAMHIASSANYPNVARIIALNDGALYVHNGAQINENVALCSEGKGRIYLVQDITVGNIYRNGAKLDLQPGTYTTDDFDFIFPNSGTASGIPEGVKYNITVKGSQPAVARVGMTPYVNFDDAVADANGGVIELLADVSFTPPASFRVKKNGFNLTELPGATDFRLIAGPDSDGVMTYALRSGKEFSGRSSEVRNISSAEDLLELAYWVRLGETFEGERFFMTKDVEWDAALLGPFRGIGTTTCAFKGEFDGDGHSVDNLLLKRTAGGLFRNAEGGVVKGVTLVNASVEPPPGFIVILR